MPLDCVLVHIGPLTTKAFPHWAPLCQIPDPLQQKQSRFSRSSANYSPTGEDTDLRPFSPPLNSPGVPQDLALGGKIQKVYKKDR